MSISETLSREAADFAPPGDFHTVGAPALLVTNESTPAGFYDEIRGSSKLDGYVVGPGCGNVMAMPEAFAGELLGMVLVDVDPAVVCAGRMLVACMARQATVEGFVSELFCGGEASLRELEREVLAAEPAATLRRQMEAQRPRLWAALDNLTAGFSRGPADVAPLLEKWATFLPPAGGEVPVRAFLAKNYDRLQPLARRGDIAVLCCSIFHPRLAAAVAALPRFGATRHLVYLSNVADHVLRRALLAQAQSRLGLRPEGEPEGKDFRSTEEFVDFLDREQVGQLRVLTAAAGVVAVDSTARHDLVLRHHDGLPSYTAGDFILDFAIDRMVVRFFDSLAGDARGREAGADGREATADSAAGAARDPWQRAPLQRAASLELYSAAVVGDLERARGALDRLHDEAAQARHAASRGLDSGSESESESAFLYAAFCLAELAHALLMARRTQTAGALQAGIEQRRGELAENASLIAAAAGRREGGARGRRKGGERGRGKGGERGRGKGGERGRGESGEPGRAGAVGTLLVAQACELAGILLEAPDLRADGQRWLDAGLVRLREELARGDGGPEAPGALGPLAEALVRLLSCDLHGPRREAVREAIVRGVNQLLQGLGENGQIAAAAPTPAVAASAEGQSKPAKAPWKTPAQSPTAEAAAVTEPARSLVLETAAKEEAQSPAPETAALAEKQEAAAVPGYEGHYREEETIYGNVRLALLLYGLSAGEGAPIEAAFQVDYFVRHRNLDSTPDTHALLAGIA